MNRSAAFLYSCITAALLSAPALRANDAPVERVAVWNSPRHLLALFGHHATQFKYDRRMIRAAEIAASHAYAKPTWRCWHFVKDALLDAGVVSSRPVSPWAKQAGEELCTRFGFRKLPVTNPQDAPVGAVIVYGGNDAGHVEMRTGSGYVSDFISSTPYPRPLIGVYVKDA